MTEEEGAGSKRQASRPLARRLASIKNLADALEARALLHPTVDVVTPVNHVDGWVVVVCANKEKRKADFTYNVSAPRHKTKQTRKRTKQLSRSEYLDFLREHWVGPARRHLLEKGRKYVWE